MLEALFCALLWLFALSEARLARTPVTPPILFTLAGILAAPLGAELQIGRGWLLLAAELGLVLLLFTDGARTDLRLLKGASSLPARLLSTGLLLTLGLGTLVARLVLPELSLWEAATLACVLAPTDAGLGQIIVESPRVPARLRQALNVEAGLNDGLCVPFFLLAVALAATASHHPGLARLIYEQLAVGAGIGVVLGLAGGWLLARAEGGWTRRPQLAVVMIPVWCFLLSEWGEASMFIAAFVAGLAVQTVYTRAGQHAVEFTEQWGQLLNLGVFFLFGLLIPRLWGFLGAGSWIYAILSLTLVRMAPVAAALYGSGMSRAEVVFAGWFGPRGLASIVLALLYLEKDLHLEHESLLVATAAGTILLSILAHGLSAEPGIGLLNRAQGIPPA